MNSCRCKSCGSEVECRGRFHTGFNNTGFLYCDQDSTVLTFSSFDPAFEAISGNAHPWTLAKEGKLDVLKMIEDNLINCECGGRFSFDNPLKCPRCNGVLSEPMSQNIYFVVLDKHIDGENVNVWRR